jgi:NhaA family Na+:H+ antiporter
MPRSGNDRRPNYDEWIASDRPLPRLVIRPLSEFLETETAGSVFLLMATLVALLWANSPWQDSYEQLWLTEAIIYAGEYEIANDLRHWINEALMSVFLFVVGLELKRELLDGELRQWKRAALPAAAAIGGMLIPALIYLLLNSSPRTAGGWGIPMATDIAFVLGILSLMSRVPPGLKTFLLTLAIVDDIGAIAVIALFYSGGLAWEWLAVAGFLVALIFIVRGLNQRWRHLEMVRVASKLCFVTLGAGVWLAVFESGVHATIAGVALAFCVNARSASEEDLEMLEEDLPQVDEEISPAERLEHFLHPWTSFGIVPLFALANAGVVLSIDALSAIPTSTVTLGVIFGLVGGKILGITVFSVAAVRLKIGLLPNRVTWQHIIGAAALAGVGFTVSLFITGLAFEQTSLEIESKIGVIIGSLIAATLGALLLRQASRRLSPI